MPAEQRSRLREALEAAMLADPRHWQGHYPGTPDEQRFARAFSLSDRCRYYWPVPTVAAAVDRLLANLPVGPVPLPLLSQYLPRQHDAIRAGRLKADPRALVRAKIAEVAGVYARARRPMTRLQLHEPAWRSRAQPDVASLPLLTYHRSRRRAAPACSGRLET